MLILRENPVEQFRFRIQSFDKKQRKFLRLLKWLTCKVGNQLLQTVWSEVFLDNRSFYSAWNWKKKIQVVPISKAGQPNPWIWSCYIINFLFLWECHAMERCNGIISLVPYNIKNKCSIPTLWYYKMIPSNESIKLFYHQTISSNDFVE